MVPGEENRVSVELRAQSTDYASVQVTCGGRIYYSASTVRISRHTRNGLRELLVDAVRVALDEALDKAIE